GRRPSAEVAAAKAAKAAAPKLTRAEILAKARAARAAAKPAPAPKAA
ncbi:MAG TPA: poly(hydroxyalkanoate) granule-associated protein, partial [Saprospirales bacterium]|nr:poly(hydroxyalkanoate) granule-associated protein [Saprospirales bacterium]